MEKDEPNEYSDSLIIRGNIVEVLAHGNSGKRHLGFISDGDPRGVTYHKQNRWTQIPRLGRADSTSQ